MLRTPAIIRATAKQIAAAADEVRQDYAAEQVQDEPSFTNQMVGRIQQSLKDFSIHGVTWKGMVLTSSGRGTQEKEFGADLLGALQIDLPDFKVAKGFLAQAKRWESHQYFAPKQFEELQRQCEDMLNHTSDAFVYLYGRDRIRVVPAIEVVGLKNVDELSQLYDRSVQSFFEQLLSCFIGDHRIDAASRDSLERLRADYRARTAFLLKAE